MVFYNLERAPRRKRPMEDSWEVAFLRGETNFKEVVTRMCNEYDHPDYPLARQPGVDLYSAMVKAVIGPDIDRPNLEPIRFETLREGLIRMLDRHIDVPPRLRKTIRWHPPVKTSSHGPYTEYYDSELAELVGERTRWLCEAFGYAFKGAKRAASSRG
jgi:hypothetical protein